MRIALLSSSSRRVGRSGVTLIEALMAIGIMTIGLIALLTFFPLAAFQMANAFKDDRTGTLAGNGENLGAVIWRNIWLDSDGVLRPEVRLRNTEATGAIEQEPSLMALDDPTAVPYPFAATYTPLIPPVPDPPTPPTIPPPLPAPNNYLNWYQRPDMVAKRLQTTPSYPVLLDPIGWRAQVSNQSKQWVTGQVVGTLGYLQRRDIHVLPFGRVNELAAAQTQKAVRLCSLLDDITFVSNGLPDTSTGFVDRMGKYNSSLLIQRMNNSLRTQTRLSVLVYEGRSATDIPAVEELITVPDLLPVPPNTPNVVTANATSLTVYYPPASGKPPFTRGWILYLGDPSPAGDVPTIATFHRVIGYADLVDVDPGLAGYYSLELQHPLKQVGPSAPAATGRHHVIYLHGLSEVFEVSDVDNPLGLGTPPRP
jgi:hypothetical protein